jgi:tRNA(Ile)-lysidine synthase TilS/MesJ
MLNVDHIVTGHNADDIAETVLMNSKLQSLVAFAGGRDMSGNVLVFQLLTTMLLPA